tara:strand:+ start:778 stop:975 length:198 start_codon:yes stop_codon:yes gene_type:complete
MNEDCAEIAKCEWVVLILLFIALPIGLAGIAVVAMGYMISTTKSNVMRMLLITIVVMAISGLAYL